MCTKDGIEIFDRATAKLLTSIPKPEQAHGYSLLSQAIPGVGKHKFLLWRDCKTISLLDIANNKIRPMTTQITFEAMPGCK